MKYSCINIQGNFISEEVLQKVETASADYQKNPTDFGFETGTNLRDEIEYSWSRIKLDWKHFSEKSNALPASDQYGTTLARKWMENFFSSIGFNLSKQKEALKGENNQTYTISHIDGNINGLPVQIVGFYDPQHPEKNTLDIKSSGGTSRLSPHGTVQEYLNVTEHIYGFATNGMVLRLIRDSGRLVKLTYVEFDLKRMLDEDKYSEFTLLYRLIHASRFINEASIIEKYYQESIETGNRIRDGLSDAVKESMQALGNGFLHHPANDALREKLRTKSITPKQYYDQLRRLVYRLLFLMVTEERDLIYDADELKGNVIKQKEVYLNFYSIARLRKLSENRYLYEKEFSDLWQGLLKSFLLFEANGNGSKIGIKPLDGDLFSETALRDINDAQISNNVLLECIRNLNEFQDKETKMLVSINYRSLDVEELGSVYEGLLELHPVIEYLESTNPANIHFTFHGGTERKTTGSYYTRPDLVNELIRSALIPVIEERVKEAGTEKKNRLNALLKLKVCDTAAGSGHIMLAAARTIAWYMARIDSGEENPAPSVYRYWLRQAIQHCIYAVDMNPDAVELCKLALWLEGHNSGKPLSFLDHKIRCGNSLVGVTDLKVLTQPLPDNAFDPVTGDDKKVCQDLKKKNKKYRETKQTDLFSSAETQIQKDQNELVKEFNIIDSISQNTVEDVHEIKKRFGNIRKSVFHEENACHLYTAAFFKTYSAIDDPKNPSSEKIAQYFLAPTQYGQIIGEAVKLSIENKFFHWPLEFPDVFEQGGFDVILGNPPWEKIQPEEKAFFRNIAGEISNLKGKNRKDSIEELKVEQPELFVQWEEYKSKIEKLSKFIKNCGDYALVSKGNLNTYLAFINSGINKTNSRGKIGLIVPSGFSTDDTAKYIFQYCIKNNLIESIFDFENRNLFFQAERNLRFSLITMNKSKLNENVNLAFGLTETSQLRDTGKIYLLATEDFEIVNPNTFTCPVFINKLDVGLVKSIYKRSKILIREDKDGNEIENPWSIELYCEGFNMTRAHHLFKKLEDLEKSNFKNRGDNTFQSDSRTFVPLLESKLINILNHRYSSFENVDEDVRFNTKAQPNYSTEIDLANPNYSIKPRYWVEKEEVAKAFGKKTKRNWLFGFRNICRGLTDYRTGIFSVFPYVGAGNSITLIFINHPISVKQACLIGNLTSIVFDYVLRQKLGGSNLNFFVIKQLPVLPPEDYSEEVTFKIVPIMIELIYTSWDIKSFADEAWSEADKDLQNVIKTQWEENKKATGGHEWSPPEWCEIDEQGIKLPPFKWDEERRAVLKAELDAIYAKLYGLTDQELRYILDPQDVYGADFPGETFRVLKDKEIKKYGEYRTKRLVLEAWERMK